MLFTDICVDLETTGTDPRTGAIIQLAAVKFNLECPKLGGVFKRSLDIPASRGWEPGTASWWRRQRSGLLETITSQAEPHQKVFEDFAAWVNVGDCVESDAIRLWAKPITFEWGFLASYFKDLDMLNPFHYRMARDIASFVEGKAMPNKPLSMSDIQFSISGAHDALNDVLMQIEYLWRATGCVK